MLSLEATKVASFNSFMEFRVVTLDELKGSIWRLYRTCASIWVVTSNHTWKLLKATCML